MDFNKLDVEEGFVLSQGVALRYLRWLAEQEFEESYQKGALGIDSESAGAYFEDLVVMAQTIVDKDWGWIKFEYSPMSASGVNVREMIVKE